MKQKNKETNKQTKNPTKHVAIWLGNIFSGTFAFRISILK